MNPKVTVRRLGFAMFALIVLAGLIVFGSASARKLFGPAPSGVAELSSISQLQTDFNQGDGSTRLVMIFSPT